MDASFQDLQATLAILAISFRFIVTEAFKVWVSCIERINGDYGSGNGRCLSAVSGISGVVVAGIPAVFETGSAWGDGDFSA